VRAPGDSRAAYPVEPAEAVLSREANGRWRPFLSSIRYHDVLVLQGTPLLGACFAVEGFGGLKLIPLVLLAAGSFLLVAHVFAINDWANIASDARDPNKARAVFLTKGVSRRDFGVFSLLLLLGGLTILAALPVATLLIALGIAVLSAAYSHPAVEAKAIPLLSSVPHVAGGVLHFLLGYSVFHGVDGRGLLIALFFALTFTAGHLNQEVRDHAGDRANGLRTNAVAFGPARTFLAGLGLFTVAYADLAALAGLGLIRPGLGWLPAALYPLHLGWSIQTLQRGLTFENVSRFQARYRLLYGLIGAAMLASLLLG
jgi:4-hydroxybenzoate polyprenyltransferase